jgi:hypothetical protein
MIRLLTLVSIGLFWIAGMSDAVAQKGKSVLIFSKTTGFRHERCGDDNTAPG